jgi:osmotically-inducible protein OsmY
MCSAAARLIVCKTQHHDEEKRMHKPNKLLELDVIDTLEWDPRIDATRIMVKADNGHVTLNGSVPTYSNRVRAADDAWTVGGVRALDNELFVGPMGEAIDDLDIAAACTEALNRDRVVPKGSVTPTVTNGRVQLRGQVRSHFQRQAAEFAVGNVDGVLAVENLIAISDEPIPSDIAVRIEKAFSRSAIVDDSKITVSNNGHTVFLTGTVTSGAAMREALETAWGAPGVAYVVNDLVVES